MPFIERADHVIGQTYVYAFLLDKFELNCLICGMQDRMPTERLRPVEFLLGKPINLEAEARPIWGRKCQIFVELRCFRRVVVGVEKVSFVDGIRQFLSITCLNFR